MAPGRIVQYHVAESDTDLQHNGVKAGDVLPMLVVRVSNPTTVNGQVFVDGPCIAKWRTSVIEGTGPGQWSWPKRE